MKKYIFILLIQFIATIFASSPKDSTIMYESFEGTFPPTGWTLNTSGAGWNQFARDISFNNVRTGDFCASHQDDTGAQNSWLISNSITLPANGSCILSFWQTGKWIDYLTLHEVAISTDGGNNWDVLYVDDQPSPNSDVTELHTQELLSLSAYKGQTINVGWHYTGDYSDQWYIDDVEIMHDFQGPTITSLVGNAALLPIIGTYACNDLTLNLTANDLVGVQTITGHYTYDGGVIVTDLPFTKAKSGDELWIATIPAEALPKAGTINFDLVDLDGTASPTTMDYDFEFIEDVEVPVINFLTGTEAFINDPMNLILAFEDESDILSCTGHYSKDNWATQYDFPLTASKIYSYTYIGTIPAEVTEVIDGKVNFTITDIANNTLNSDDYIVRWRDGQIEFWEDFETGSSKWYFGGDWGIVEEGEYTSATHSLTESPGGDYSTNVSSVASLLSPLDFSSYISAKMSFWCAYDIENGFDYMYLDVSSDGGSTWANLKSWDGEGVDWHEEKIALDAFVGTTEFNFRFHFVSDGAYEVNGMYIDDIKITTYNEGSDITPPIIDHFPYEPKFHQGKMGEYANYVDVYDPSGVNAVEIVYSVDSVSKPNISATLISENQWEFTIPTQQSGAVVDYTFWAQDASGYLNEGTSSQSYRIVCGDHQIYDSGIVSYYNTTENGDAMAVKISVPDSLSSGTHLAYLLLRNYATTGMLSDDMTVHVWDDDNGVPGPDLITPFLVTPEANNLENTSAMSLIDLRPENLYVDSIFWIGFSSDNGIVYSILEDHVAEGVTAYNRSFSGIYNGDGTWNWSINSDYNYNFRAVLGDILENNIAVLDPNGGETLERGNKYEIKWVDIISFDVKIELYQHDIYHSDIISATPSDGSFMWNVPTTLYGDEFQVKISSTFIFAPDDNDMSDNYFSINKNSNIFITSPQIAEIVEMNDPHTILWSDNMQEDAIISLFKDIEEVVSFKTPSDGSYSWNFHTNDMISGTDYYLKVSSALYPDVIEQVGPFTIKGTNVYGEASGIWTEANSPYILIDSIKVNSTNTLNIEPQVKIEGLYVANDLLLEGTMISTGESNRPVIFENIDLSINNASEIDSSKFKYTTFDKNGVITFNNTFGGSSNDFGNSMQITSDGGYIITGSTESYGSGGKDVWLVKIDCNGNLEWGKTFGGSNDDEGNCVILTSDGGYVITGTTQSFGVGFNDVWLIKTDSNGNELWNKTFGGASGEIGYSVIETFRGEYVITGFTESFATGTTDINVWLIKTDENGNELWNKTFSHDSPNEIAKGNSVKQTSDGGFIIAGSWMVVTPDVWLIKTDRDGNLEWENSFGDASPDAGYSVHQTVDGGYIISGIKDDTIDTIWLIKTDLNGVLEWDNTFGNVGYKIGFSVNQTVDGGYIIVGDQLIKTDSSGNEEWVNAEITGKSVIQTQDGGYIIAGTDGSDVQLIKTDPKGNVATQFNPAVTIDNNSKVVIQNSSFTNSKSDYAIEVSNALPVITSSLVSKNRGGIKFSDSSPQFIINNTIVDNDSIGIFFNGNSDVRLMNNIIFGNGGDEIYLNFDDSDPDFSYNNIEGGELAFGLNTGVTYTGSYTDNIDTDPLFVTDTYNLQETSPCKNTGYPGLTEVTLGTLYIPQNDLTGNLRLSGEIDMGCNEYYEVVLTPESPTNIVINISSNVLTIDWDVMDNANSYLVYNSNDPYGIFELVTVVTTNTWDTTIDASTKKFYYIIASSELVKAGGQLKKKVILKNTDDATK